MRDWIHRAMGCLVPAALDFRLYQTGLKSISEVDVKADQSLATVVDHAIEAQVLDSLALEMPEIAVIAEEGGALSGSGGYYMYFDPVDGTRELTTETALSVMILGLMRREARGCISPTDLLIGCIICEPSTGRVWAAEQGCGCMKYIVTSDGDWEEIGPCRVWDGPLSSQTSVFLDSSQGFLNTRKAGNHRQILTDAQNAKLYGRLNASAHVRILGSNGQIQALVANGARGVAGSVSLALGWPWDACGTLLVTEAGGAALSLHVADDGELSYANPLHPNSYELLVTANNRGNADWLCARLIGIRSEYRS